MAKKSKGKRKGKKTDRSQAHARAQRAKKYVSEIGDEFIKKANAGKLSQGEFSKAVQALRKIVADPHLTGIRSGAVKLSLESLSGNALIVKVTIGTAKTRKRFSVRRGL